MRKLLIGAGACLFALAGCGGSDGSGIDRPQDQAFSGGPRDNLAPLSHEFTSVTLLGTTDEAATVTSPGSSDSDPTATGFSILHDFGGGVLPADPGFDGPTASGEIELVLTDEFGTSQTIFVDVEVNP